jgi:hypothetical protein
MKLSRVSFVVASCLSFLIVSSTIFIAYTNAQSSTSNQAYGVQVSPSPLVDTVVPGATNNTQLTILNVSSTVENLKITTGTFAYNSQSGSIKINSTTPPQVAQYITFSNPSFNLNPGQSIPESIKIALPKDTAFNYSFVFLIEKQQVATVSSGAAYNAAIAIFALLNVNRPGAKASLSVVNFNTNKHIYEYLPVNFKTSINNNGNTIISPYGDVYIQRDKTSSKPISTLPFNSTNAYVLPDTTRSFTNTWTSGFPVPTITTSSTGSQNVKLSWEFSKLNDLRIGEYTANLVAVYNNGSTDIPITRTVTFWVIPWIILIIIFIAAVIVLFNLWLILRKLYRFIKKLFRKNNYNV